MDNQTILELYRTCLSSDDNVYYELDYKNFTIDELDNPDKCRIFIKKLLVLGEKLTINVDEVIDLLEGKRVQHIVSLWLFGLVLFHENKKVKNNILPLINSNYSRCNECAEKTFSYIWLIACLFHDLGYVYEEKKEMRLFYKRKGYS